MTSVGNKAFTIHSRQLIPQTWEVTLIDSSGTRYELGSFELEDSVSIPLTSDVPDGTYQVEVVTNGLAWRGLVQKNLGTVTIDRTSSEPVLVDLPLLTDFDYDIYEGWIRLRWNGDVAPEQSGLVSAGIWLSYGNPSTADDPNITIPLFSSDSEHFYLVQEEDYPTTGTWDGGYWVDGFWENTYWHDDYWAVFVSSAVLYAGLAPISATGVVGLIQSIILPDRSVIAPDSVLEEEV